MICRILLLISLNCVCGAFVVNVTQTSYQAEENHNITLEWTFTTTADTSPDSLYIFCEMKTDHKVSVLFRLRGGVEVPESQDQQFVGRVQLDKDVLRDGRLRLHVSRLRTEDSGRYRCKVWRNNILNSSECWLNVSAARDRPEPERSNTDTPERPNTACRGRISLYCVLGLTTAVVVVLRPVSTTTSWIRLLNWTGGPSRMESCVGCFLPDESSGGFRKCSSSAGSEETV